MSVGQIRHFFIGDESYEAGSNLWHRICTAAIDNGYSNLRVGAIIMKNGRFLMVGNQRNDYLCSVGGRIQFGETAEEAVVREVFEETGVRLEADRLGFIHENFFHGDFEKVDENSDITDYPTYFREKLKNRSIR